MTWQSLLEPDIQKFIRQHENDDVAALALKKMPDPSCDAKRILDQIKARQKAKVKLPQWLEHDDIVFPPANIMEQASSSATARYKVGLVKGESFVDLTGGAGADSWALAQHFKSGQIIEINKDAAKLIDHNMKCLSPAASITVHNCAAEDFVADMVAIDLAIIDPARRDDARKGKFKLEDCAPDITALLPTLLQKTKSIMIKTSPMLDISEGIKALKSEQGSVHEVHVIEWRNECKELVFILKASLCEQPKIIAVSINDQGEVQKYLSFTQEEEANTSLALSMPKKYLYEPGPAFQKSGGFNSIARRFNVEKLHAHTHLYSSDELRPDFPGRAFKICAQYPPKKENIPVKKANLKARNFPMSTENLRKKLKIQDGGPDYLFACTLQDGSKAILHGQKT
ncbi:MAG: class I SAM-dependent methyltransferase [Pseudomonadota bacterium]